MFWCRALRLSASTRQCVCVFVLANKHKHFCCDRRSSKQGAVNGFNRWLFVKMGQALHFNKRRQKPAYYHLTSRSHQNWLQTENDLLSICKEVINAQQVKFYGWLKLQVYPKNNEIIKRKRKSILFWQIWSNFKETKMVARLLATA